MDLSNMFHWNDNLKLVDCSQMQHSHTTIKDLFTRLTRKEKIILPDDCVVILPNSNIS